MWEKLKSWVADDVVFFGLLIVLVGFVGYGLGQRSQPSSVVTPDRTAAPVTIVDHSTPPPVLATGTAAVVGSRSGTKYHLPDCPGAQQMNPENRVAFATVEAAKAAGYGPAANCPGLMD